MVYKVLVVDDSLVVRRLVCEVLGAEPEIEVVGSAPNGEIALAEIARLRPDLVTLDIEMPVLDGLGTLDRLRRTHPRLPVVMMSSLTQRGAAVTLEALERGADDYVAKPSGSGGLTASRAVLRDELVPKILALCTRRRLFGSPDRPRPASPPPRAPRVAAPSSGALRPSSTGPSKRVDVVAIGSSTGGPDALTQLLPALPPTLPVPVLIVQHMPPVFTAQFAARLDARAALRVSEAADGDLVAAGRVAVAPGGRHLTVRREASRTLVRLHDGPPENYCRPAVDVLFRSVVETYGAHVLAVVLTGMGSDGALGAAAIKEAGGTVYAQDEESSVVWGMPGSVVSRTAADRVLPLAQMADAIVSQVLGAKRTRS